MKFCIYWPYHEGCKFDHEYYVKKHLPMAQKKIGACVTKISCDAGMPSPTGEPPKYTAVGYLYFNDMQAFLTGLGAIAAEMGADIPNFTDITNGFNELSNEIL